MYTFIDTNQWQGASPLPAEALKFDGEYLENLIEGYRTLQVSGRELLENEIDEYKVGTADGSRYKGKRYPPRVITVTYQLLAESDEAFRTAYNKLNAILSKPEAKLEFRDEPDKYFVGTKRGNNQVKGGVNHVVGEIEFYCTNPFKYTTEEKEVRPTLDGNNTFVENYAGKQPSHPNFTVDFQGDCGYVAFADARGHILQFGNPEEVDKEQKERSEVLLHDTMQEGVSGWIVNNAPIIATNSVIQQGSFKSTERHGTKCVEPGSYGTLNSNVWYGPSCRKNFSGDNIGAYWDCEFRFFCILGAETSHNDMGMLQMAVLDSTGKNLAAVTFAKTNRDNHQGICKLHVEGKEVRQFAQDFSSGSDKTTWENGICRIHREKRATGDNSEVVIFQIGQSYHGPYPVKSGTSIGGIVFFAGMYDKYAIKNIGVRSVKLTQHHVPYWSDIPNKFGLGDRLEIDCGTGNILLNGLPELRLGALGNDWDAFSLLPGNNQVKCFYSGWAQKQPQIAMKYREVYI